MVDRLAGSQRERRPTISERWAAGCATIRPRPGPSAWHLNIFDFTFAFFQAPNVLVDEAPAKEPLLLRLDAWLVEALHEPRDVEAIIGDIWERYSNDKVRSRTTAELNRARNCFSSMMLLAERLLRLSIKFLLRLIGLE